jgi:hypothetical protein
MSGNCWVIRSGEFGETFVDPTGVARTWDTGTAIGMWLGRDGGQPRWEPTRHDRSPQRWKDLHEGDLVLLFMGAKMRDCPSAFVAKARIVGNNNDSQHPRIDLSEATELPYRVSLSRVIERGRSSPPSVGIDSEFLSDKWGHAGIVNLGYQKGHPEDEGLASRRFEFIVDAAESRPEEGELWTREEVQAVLEAYFEMLRMEIVGQKFRKSDFRKKVMAQCPGRSTGAVEYKFQNVSAVLEENNLSWIDGYKPARNYQRLLSDEIKIFLDKSEGLARSEPQPPNTRPTATPTWGSAACPPPPPRPPMTPRSKLAPRLASKIDYALKEASNRKLGEAGEKFVLELERDKLIRAGQEGLAIQVEHSSVTRGDGLGYDIASFTVAGAPLRIEVKTTRLGADSPFFMSPAEFDFASATPLEYQLARVFHWGSEPKVFLLNRQQVRSLQKQTAQFRCWV